MYEMNCIVCPSGCLLTAEKNGDEVTVAGNKCAKGEEFAKAEILSPMRTLTTTVRTTFPEIPVLPVRTDGEIPKGKIFEAMKAINGILIDRPIRCGETVLEDVAATGVRVIATYEIAAGRQEPRAPA